MMQLPWQITQPCIPVRTWAGPLRPQVGAEVCNGDKDLPQECGSLRVIAVLRVEHLWESLAPSVQEAGLWPRDVLERFRATGVRPQWHDAPGGHRGILERRLSAPSLCVKGEDALALYGEMTRHQALKISEVQGLVSSPSPSQVEEGLRSTAMFLSRAEARAEAQGRRFPACLKNCYCGRRCSSLWAKCPRALQPPTPQASLDQARYCRGSEPWKTRT